MMSSGRRAKAKRRASTAFAYTSVFVIVISMIAVGYQQPQRISADSVSQTTSPTASQLATAPSVDQIMGTDVAGNLASQTNMPVAADIANLSISLDARAALAQTSESSINKPQIIQATAASRDITSYTAKAGDTVQSVAALYSLQPDTIKWANNLVSDSLSAGKALTIPPIDGVVYTTKSGDTAASLASTYSADSARIVSFNDLEMRGITAGQQIVIPGGTLPENQRPGYQAPASGARASNQIGTGYRINTSMAGAAVGNKYAYGNCTWYAYNRRAELGRPVGSYWGNANTWAVYARAAGYPVDRTPAAGAVLVDTAGYFGHVAVVESVDPSTGAVTISEMNNYAYGGFGIVDRRTISAGQASAYQYIH